MARLRGLVTGHGGTMRTNTWKVSKPASHVRRRKKMAYPPICPEQIRVSLLHRIYDSSKLAKGRYVDGTPKVDCLENRKQNSLNALLVQATRTGNRCKRRKRFDNYYLALPGSARVEVIRILIGAGADLSAIWTRKVRRLNAISPFCAMFERIPGFLDDIKVFIEKGALQSIPSHDLVSCIFSAVRNLNIPVLELLMAQGLKIPGKEPVKWEAGDRNSRDNYWKLLYILAGVKYRNHAEKVGILVDLNLFKSSETLDESLARFISGIPTVALGNIPILSFLTRGVRPELDDLQFLCAKGCLSPPPEAFLLAIQRRDFGFLVLVVYVFLNRGIVVEFPELRMEDIEYRNEDGEIEPRLIPDSMKTQAALLAEMIRRSTKSCPASFLDMMTFISTGAIQKLRDRTVPRLQDLCILAVRTKVLIPDVKERFAENWVVRNKVPAHPRLSLPAGCLVSPTMESKMFLGDLIGSWMANLDDNVSETDDESDTDGEQ